MKNLSLYFLSFLLMGLPAYAYESDRDTVSRREWNLKFNAVIYNAMVLCYIYKKYRPNGVLSGSDVEQFKISSHRMLKDKGIPLSIVNWSHEEAGPNVAKKVAIKFLDRDCQFNGIPYKRKLVETEIKSWLFDSKTRIID